MSFQKDFDELFNNILTDYKNQFPEADASQGSLIFIKSACLASALWGLYKYQEWISKQIFPDTADSEYLDHHGWVRGLSRTYGETDSAYLVRLLSYIRRPPAGGNKYDYINWALEIDNVAAAYCYPLAQGLGSVDVVITANEANTGSELPSSSAVAGTATLITASRLIDSSANFLDAQHTVAAGDIVINTISGASAAVVSVDSANQLTLDADIFQNLDENYIIHLHSGTNTSVTASKLIDSSANFTDSNNPIKKGDVVKNLTDSTESTVVSVDSATQITLTADIFTSTGKKYIIKSLIAQVKEYIDSARPVTAWILRVLAPTILTQAVSITVTGSNVNKSQIASDINAYINALIPDQTLYRSQIMAIAIENGAENVTITTPASDVVPAAYQMIRPGAVTVG